MSKAPFTEQTNTVTQVVSTFLEEHWRPSTPDMQADVEAICEKWGITPPNFYEKSILDFPVLDKDMSALTVFASRFYDSWPDAYREEDTDSEATTPERTTISPYPAIQYHHSPLLPCPKPVSPSTSVSNLIDYSRNVSEVWTPELNDVCGDSPSRTDSSRGCSSPTALPSPLMPRRHIRLHSEERPAHASPFAPDRRPLSLPNHSVSAFRPYPHPSSRAIRKDRSPPITGPYPSSSSTPARGVVGISADIHARLIPESRGGIDDGKQSTQIIFSHASLSIAELPVPRACCGRIPVPLGEWRPARAPKLPSGVMRTIEFWTKNHTTEERTLGTFLSDRFQEDTGRSLISENSLPFPAKKEKGFNLRILWPGYPDFSKKISVHKPLSECTVRDVRDWIFNAVSEFIRTSGEQDTGNHFWRVGIEDKNAIHLDDLVLVRLKQVARGTWVPELDLLDWERTL